MLEFTHVDVFAAAPYSGNPLPVFFAAQQLAAAQMLAITRELRQFEAVFLTDTEQPSTVRARVFDQVEELPFAGHPLLGAAAALHFERGGPARCAWNLLLGERSIGICSERTGLGFETLMEQGPPLFARSVAERAAVAHAFSLATADLIPDLPLEVVSTGLEYLVIPVRGSALARARIHSDITGLLGSLGARFAVLLDEAGGEIRHWNNDGVLEDVATGSAAGVVGAYRLKHGLARDGVEFTLRQGRFTGRPSRLRVIARGTGAVTSVTVGGTVAVIGRGQLEQLP